jgi:hypothetical protein
MLMSFLFPLYFSIPIESSSSGGPLIHSKLKTTVTEYAAMLGWPVTHQQSTAGQYSVLLSTLTWIHIG